MGRLTSLIRGLLTAGLILATGLAAPMWAGGQEPVRVERLTISLWPEYDDPRLLVILNGTLTQSNVELRVPLPDGAALHAVAFGDDQGNLLNATWRVEGEGERRVVVVSVPTRHFHVEYYVDAITAGEETVVRARIPAPEAEVLQATLVVQEPAGTADLRGTPPLGPLEPGGDGLRYASRGLGPLRPGDTVVQEVRYRRVQPGPTVRILQRASEATPPPDRAGRPWLWVGLAGILVLGAGGAIFLWSVRGRSRKALSIGSGEGKAGLAKYCPNCGHPFGARDRFCTMCGTRRPGMPGDRSMSQLTGKRP